MSELMDSLLDRPRQQHLPVGRPAPELGAQARQGDHGDWTAALGLAKDEVQAGGEQVEVGGTPPAYRNAVEPPQLQARFRQDVDVWAFYELLPTYIPMPNFPGFAAVRALGDQMLREIWAGKVSARDGLNEYTRLAQQTLDEALRA
jgi:ABC-type glycerol-3-phosphate transport system substrate-binding protein